MLKSSIIIDNREKIREIWKQLAVCGRKIVDVMNKAMRINSKQNTLPDQQKYC